MSYTGTYDPRRRPPSAPARRTLLAPLLLAAVVVAVAATAGDDPPASAPDADAVVATYRGGRITASDYRSWLRAEGRDGDGPVEREQAEALALHRSLAQSLDQTEGGIDGEMRSRLEDAERRILADALRRRAVESAVVSDRAVRSMLAELDDKRHKPAKVKLRNLFKRVPPDAGAAERAAVRAAIEALRAQLAAGADWDALARRESDSETRFRGGRMGVAAPGDLPPALEEVAFGLAPGEISDILDGPAGFTLLRCDEVIPARTLSQDEAADRIRRHLEREARAERWTALRDELLGAARPRYQPERARTGDDDPVVARFDGGSLRRSDLARALARRRRAPELAALAEDRLTAELEGLVVERMAARRARDEGLHLETAVADRLRWRRIRLLATEALRREVARRFVPLERAELEAAFAADRDRFVEPERLALRVLRLDAADDAVATFSRAELLAADLRAGERSFAPAASELSRHPSAERGGELGWRTRSELSAFGRPFYETAIALEPGAVGGPVRDGDAVWLIELAGRRPARPQTFEEAERRLRMEVGSRKTQELQRTIERERIEALELRLADG